MTIEKERVSGGKEAVNYPGTLPPSYGPKAASYASQ